MKRSVRWALVAGVVVLAALGVLRVVSSRQAQQKAAALAQASREDAPLELAASDVYTARVISLAQGLPVSGALKAVNSAFVKARVAGELQALTVREGDFVTAGQVIARIDVSEYAARVRQAQQLASSAKAQADVAQRQYDNNQALVNEGFISKTALDTSLANLNAARASYQAAVAGADVASKSVQDTVLKAPIAGQVAQRLAQPGERVAVDTRVIEIVDLRQLELEAALSASDGAQVQVGQTAELRVEGSGQVVMAHVARINPSAQAGSRNVLAYLRIDAPPSAATPVAAGSGALRQGLFAQGTLGTLRTELLAVPVSSVRTDKPAPYVQTLEAPAAADANPSASPAHVVVHRSVTLGQRGTAGPGGEPVVAVTGLTDGATVLRAAVGALREGTRVTTAAASSGRAENAKSAP
jgi:membrane fusion protein, multidrug efflux system